MPLAATAVATGDQAAPPSNLLLILVDDLNLALGCYGHPAAHTPNLDRLAARGLRFANAFCTYPLCGPSRTALLTGQRPESLPMPNNEVAWRDLHPELRSLPQIARATGVHTAAFGKIFHHGIPAAGLAAWREANPGAPLAHTYDDPPSWNESFCEKADIREALAQGPAQVIDGPPYGGASLHTIRTRNPQVLPDRDTADRAAAFLRAQAERRRAGDSTPFFLAAGFHKPHVPLIAPEKWWAHYDSLNGEELAPPTWFKPANLPPGTLKRDRFHRGATEEQRRHLYRGYLACVSHMDEQLGRVLGALAETGLASTTRVAFVADHGYHLGEQGQWDKMMLLDPALRVPMILAGPGIPEGRVCGAVVESFDLFPTLCGLVAWAPRQSVHGRDLAPWIADPAAPSERAAFAWVKEGLREGWTIRTATHRYGLTALRTASDAESAAPTPKPYLFDLSTDPHETANLADQPGSREPRHSLGLRLREHFRLPQPGGIRA